MSASDPDYILRTAAPDAAGAQPYDFARPRSVSDRQLEAAEGVHDALADGLAVALAEALGEPVAVACSSLDEVAADDFGQSRAEPTTLVGLQLGEGGPRVALDLAPALALFLVERHLGGSDPLGADARALSDLERAVVERRWLPLVGVAFAEAWGSTPPRPYRFAPRIGALDLAPPGARVVTTDVDVTVGGATARLALCYPTETLRALLDVSQSRRTTGRPTDPPADLPLDLRAELGRTRLSVRDLLHLAPGDVIPLAQAADAPMPVWVGDRFRFEARTGVRGKRLALQVLTPPAPPIDP